MSKERKRRIGTAQIKMRMMNVFIGNTATTPDAQGFDRFGISSVVDNGVGDYTINIRSAFGRPDIMAWCTGVIAGSVITIGSVTASSVQVIVQDGAGAPLDADFFLMIMGSEFGYDV